MKILHCVSRWFFREAKFRYFLFHVLSFLLMTSLMRLLVYFLRKDIFSSESFLNIIAAFFDGMRFDLCIYALGAGAFWILCFLPLFHSYVRYFFWGILEFVWTVFLIAWGGTVVFISFTGHYPGVTEIQALTDLPYLVDMGLAYWWLVLLLLLLGVGHAYFGRRIFSKEHFHFHWKTWSGQFLFLLIIIFFSLTGKPRILQAKILSPIDAFSGGSNEYALLTLNGPFSAFSIWRQQKKMKMENPYYGSGDKKSEEVLYQTLKLPRDKFLFDQISLGSNNPQQNPQNVFIFILESWSSKYINEKNTPFFMKLKEEGTYFSNFYPNNHTSILGITALLTSTPYMPPLPILGKGLELSKVYPLGQIFAQEGYHTILAQSSARISFRMDSIAEALGFQDYFGKEDFPRIHQQDSTFYGWDYEGQSFLVDYLSEQKPFFSVFFTGTTHVPYMIPEEKFAIYPHDKRKINGFYNTLSYADWSLQQFFERARQKKWFKNTIFVFVADHTLSRSLGTEHRIPLLIWRAADEGKKGKLVKRLGSQVDVLATLFDYADWKLPLSGIGQSLLKENSSRAPLVLFYDPPVVGIQTEQGELFHNFRQTVKSSFVDKEREHLSADVLLHLHNALFNEWKNNRWWP